MKNPRVDYFTVGAFVLAMLVALVVCLAILAGRTGASDRYYTHFDNVLGVIPGTKVYFEGFDVGAVEAIEPAPDPSKGRYRVVLDVDQGWHIPEDSVAVIIEPSLLAAITIDIRSGTSARAAAPGSEIAGQDLQSVFTAVNTLASELETIVERDLRPILDAVSSTSPLILENLEGVTADLAAVSEQATALFSPENTALLDGMIADLAATAANLDELTDALESSLRQVDALVGQVDGLVMENSEEFEGMVDDLSHTLDAIARRVDTISSNLESTTHHVNEFSRQIRDNPGVLVRGTSGEPEPAP